ncbi:DUF4351 domain-containing protein [Fuchsiella alkaliacetigena]|uniref:DUF4351 domain-containing protein n=1 Tax=Fuchsiella alkaliacetigena TaxID=957042 RepID=UPI00200B3482|nr:DUF4351 domain-containing protein [Fuchsiella alkaliacetigena]MCK8825877.1 Rpn family recombination-promoting nuclease/putative transposase [Fuchsiella alkaliacetigena]
MTDRDGSWKTIIEVLFEDFVYFFLPKLAKKIDFEQDYEFLDKELQKIVPKSKEKKRYIDKLVKVHLKNGEEKWVLIHIEVQGYRDDEFRERMFTYFYRIYDRYQQKIAALAIFTDKNQNYQPASYEYQFFGTKLEYNYNTYKVLASNEDELIAQENCFALAVLAQKYALQAKKDEDKKFEFKMKLMKLLLEKGYSKVKIRQLFLFIDQIVKLNDSLKQKLFYERLEEQEGGEIMRVMGDFEEFVSRKAKKEGRKEGMVELVEKQLLNKFEFLPDEYKERLRKQDKDKLDVIAVKIMEIENLKELEDYLN